MPDFDLAETLRAASLGEAQAWEDLVDAYGRRVFGLLLRQCADRELAQELTQATFVKLVEKLEPGEEGSQHQKDGSFQFTGYVEKGRFEPWLFRIAMNKLRDEMRRRKRQATPTDMSPGAARQDAGAGDRWAAQEVALAAHGGRQGGLGENPVEVLSRGEQIEQLRQVIAALPEADREVLHLRHTAGLSFAQIAQTLDQPLGTVLARGHRALGKLKKKMAQAG